ncbi:MAG TPA: glutathione ABC transporter ATP-binding protein, partial [Streptosporangiaceae bacterium]|nr:glutathione ABC transporter ATP-binding protein [Streptosporangiaceae bacterium]
AGAPPELDRLPRGCPFAPRCAWALEACWQEMPPLTPLEPAWTAGAAGPHSGSGAHLLACHNPVTPGEAEAGEPARPGFRPAPPTPEFGPVAEETA